MLTMIKVVLTVLINLHLFYCCVTIHPKWLRKPGDSFEPCGYLDIADGYDTETICPICLEQENGQSWIQCPYVISGITNLATNNSFFSSINKIYCYIVILFLCYVFPFAFKGFVFPLLR